MLPSIAMGASLAAILTRMVRTAMLEELGQDYIRTARAKGLSETAVVCRHALPNALVPIVTVVGLQFGALLAGAIVTETIFSWPGLGRLTVSAISNRDYALVQGCLLSIGLTYVLVNLLTDVVYRWVNPRMAPREARLSMRDYSVFDSSAYRNWDVEWLFPQEKATLLDLQRSTCESKTL